MPTNIELERMLTELTRRVQVLEEEHLHQMSGLNHVGIPTKIKNGRFVRLGELPKPTHLDVTATEGPKATVETRSV